MKKPWRATVIILVLVVAISLSSITQARTSPLASNIAVVVDDGGGGSHHNKDRAEEEEEDEEELMELSRIESFGEDLQHQQQQQQLKHVARPKKKKLMEFFLQEAELDEGDANSTFIHMTTATTTTTKEVFRDSRYDRPSSSSNKATRQTENNRKLQRYYDDYGDGTNYPSTAIPTATPSSSPTTTAATTPTETPSLAPTTSATTAPTVSPSSAPTTTPTVSPSSSPTITAATAPTASPSSAPTTPPTTTILASSAPTLSITTTSSRHNNGYSAFFFPKVHPSPSAIIMESRDAIEFLTGAPTTAMTMRGAAAEATTSPQTTTMTMTTATAVGGGITETGFSPSSPPPLTPSFPTEPPSTSVSLEGPLEVDGAPRLLFPSWAGAGGFSSTATATVTIVAAVMLVGFPFTGVIV